MGCAERGGVRCVCAAPAVGKRKAKGEWGGGARCRCCRCGSRRRRYCSCSRRCCCCCCCCCWRWWCRCCCCCCCSCCSQPPGGSEDAAVQEGLKELEGLLGLVRGHLVPRTVDRDEGEVHHVASVEVGQEARGLAIDHPGLPQRRDLGAEVVDVVLRAEGGAHRVVVATANDELELPAVAVVPEEEPVQRLHGHELPRHEVVADGVHAVDPAALLGLHVDGLLDLGQVEVLRHPILRARLVALPPVAVVPPQDVGGHVAQQRPLLAALAAHALGVVERVAVQVRVRVHVRLQRHARLNVRHAPQPGEAALLDVLVPHGLGDHLLPPQRLEHARVARRPVDVRVEDNGAGEEQSSLVVLHDFGRKRWHVVPAVGLAANVEVVDLVGIEAVHPVLEEHEVVLRRLLVPRPNLGLDGEAHARGGLHVQHVRDLVPRVLVNAERAVARGAEGPILSEEPNHPRAPRPAVGPEHHRGVLGGHVGGLNEPVVDLLAVPDVNVAAEVAEADVLL
mmetsp:Transcript_20014/g.67833  ORF Transcript_20014/g.67833 Transcript_20014/m.67833 type:complete len:507 (+) Transcript_20014:68-1588(+)